MSKILKFVDFLIDFFPAIISRITFKTAQKSLQNAIEQFMLYNMRVPLSVELWALVAYNKKEPNKL